MGQITTKVSILSVLTDKDIYLTKFNAHATTSFVLHILAEQRLRQSGIIRFIKIRD